MIAIISGLPGAGKSLKLSRIIWGLLVRNEKWFKSKKNVYKEKRLLWTNLKLSSKVMKRFDGYIKEWVGPSELVDLRNCDVIWDEMAVHLDSTQWQNMSLELKRWLQQHRKFGVEIYGTAQDFAQVDKSARRVVSDLLYLTKLIGSPDKSPTKPPVKHVWGLVVVRRLDPQKYDEATSKFESQSFPSFMFINREDLELYDSYSEVKVGEHPKLRHIDRVCERVSCGHHKVMHV